MPRLSQPLIVAGAILVGVLLIYFTQKQSDPCQIKYNNFVRAERGLLYEQSTKKRDYLEKLLPQMKACRGANSEGPCTDLLSSLDKLAFDLETFSPACEARFAEDKVLRARLQGSIRALVQLAWGEQPPEELTSGWLGNSDLKVFCRVWRSYRDIFSEDWQVFRQGVLQTLAGEKPEHHEVVVDADSKAKLECVNCNKRAVETIGIQETLGRSLFGLPCAK